MQGFGQPVVVTLNRHDTDSEEEINIIKKNCEDLGVSFAVNEAFLKGGDGAVELAQAVVDSIEHIQPLPIHFTYPENDTIEGKIEKVCKRIYGASGVEYSKTAKKKLEAYLYPLVKQEVLKRLEAIGPKQKALVEVQILPGSGLEDIGDYNLVILSSKENQEKRLRLEGKPAEALLALNKDWPERKARLLASQIVFNTYPEKEISEKLEELAYLFD
jgi:hypothetical protein